jgi:hypothetical protein
MKKYFITVAICTAVMLVLTGCGGSTADSNDGSVTYFIDNRVYTGGGVFAAYHNVHAHPEHERVQWLELTPEQWREIRALFGEGNWTETEPLVLDGRSTADGFISFHSEGETLAFLIPDRTAYTMELASENPEYAVNPDNPNVRNRWYEVDEATMTAIESKAAEFFALPTEPFTSEWGG